MISQLDDALLEISVYISSMLLGKSAQIEKAKDYIYANYSNSEISLEEVAKHVNMSVSYFSRFDDLTRVYLTEVTNYNNIKT